MYTTTNQHQPSYIDERPAYFYRALLLIVSLSYLVFGLFYFATTHSDPMPFSWRLIMSLPFLLLFILSYKIKWIQEKIEEIAYIGSYLGISQVVWMAYISGYPFDLSLSIIITIIFGNLLFNAHRTLLYCNLFLLSITTLSILLTESPAIYKPVLIITLFFTTSISFLLSRSRYQAKKRLELSQKRYYNLFINMKNGFAALKEKEDNEDYILLQMNRALEELIGYRSDQLQGKSIGNIASMLEEKTGFNWRILFNQVKIEGEIEFEQYLKDSKIYCQITAYSPKKGHYALLFNDITSLRKAEKKLRRNESRLREITENMKDMISRIDRQGVFEYLSPSYSQVLGYSLEELKGTSIQQLLHPDDRAKVISLVKKSLREQVIESCELRFKRADGRYIWVELTGRVLKNNKEKVIGAVISSREITTRIKDRAQIREVKEHLQSIIKASPAAIISFDNRKRITGWNPAAERILGWTKREVLHSSFPFNANSSQKDIALLTEQVKKGEKISGIEVEVYNRDNRKVILSLSAAPLYDSRKELKGVMAVLMDITEQKRAKQMVQDSLKKASRLQKSLLPQKMPSIPGLEIASTHKGASLVSGDYFYTVQLEDRLLLLMADVTGHGFDAALVTVFISTFLQRQLQRSKTLTARDLLEDLSKEYLSQGFPDDYSIEVFIGLLRLKELTMEYAAAGAVRAFLYNCHQLQPLADAHGMPINNALQERIYGQGRTSLQPGEMLLLHTDGLDEPFSTLQELEDINQKHWLKSRLKEASQLPLNEVLTCLVDDSLSATGKEKPDDDITLLALRGKDQRRE